MLFRFLGLQALVQVPWVNVALRREGQRHYDLGVATEIELREQAQRKKTGTDGEGGKVSVLLRLEEKNRVFSDRREAKFSSTESARKKIILQAPRSHACLSQLIFLRREGGRAGFYR